MTKGEEYGIKKKPIKRGMAGKTGLVYVLVGVGQRSSAQQKKKRVKENNKSLQEKTGKWASD